ncbi:hypothetical protein CANINC_002227 [Pichia inconspicua]|uniref:Protein BZZ1 n=1 Tax=Pichia inconspicua TaxID=52247 RepID=A0A4T0X1Q6_9ASCO|nr:hypothetical protein CANINC_002227 [[Candida] inconspicua]
MTTPSLGSALPDAFKVTHAWVDANLSFLTDISQFYKEKATIEREYAEKLSKLASEHLSKTSKQASLLAVGPEPAITPGSLDSASVVAWKETLIQTENIAKERRSLANNLDINVASSINKLHTKYTSLSDRWKSFNEELVHTRDKNYSDIQTKKKAYDAACEAMESQRAKTLKSSSDRAQEKLHKRETEMNIAKNDYLISISVANRLKDKFYYQDIPELLDGLQDLNQTKVAKLNTIWLSTSVIERQSLTKIAESFDAIDIVVKQNLPNLDTMMFMKHNTKNWTEPVDFNYIPSPIWHDDGSMIVNNESVQPLKALLNSASATYESLQRTCDDNKQVVEELILERNNLLGDVFEKVEIKSSEDFKNYEDMLARSISALQKFINNDTRRVIAEVQIETVQAVTDGIDMSYSGPTEKKSRFGIFRKSSNPSSSAGTETLSSGTTHISIIPSNTKSRLFDKLNKFAETYNTPVGATLPSTANNVTATALYPYDAAGDDETSITKGENVAVLEQDDSGWTYVKSSAGTGLVPTSYLEIHKSKPPPPKVVPRKIRKNTAQPQFQMLYDYVAQGDDELTVNKGDVLTVVSPDDGGWTEVEKNGQTGLVPTSYGSLI